jgi:hypothetical protein
LHSGLGRQVSRSAAGGTCDVEFHLILPDDFVEYGAEVEAKGWFAGARLTVSGTNYRLTFFDLARLGQEIESEFERGDIFFESNLVVVRPVTMCEMERAAEWLVKSGREKRLVAE